MTTLTTKLNDCRSQGKALLAVNFYNLETLKAIMLAASKLNHAVIIQLSRSSIEYMKLPVAVSLAKSSLRHYGVEGWLHLDHGDSIELVRQCLDAGFDSVMIDASEKTLQENIDITTKVVELAKPYGANVEAELGYVAKLNQDTIKEGFTQASEAKTFVESTGVNALAVAIGSAHGFYKETPSLKIDLLKEISEQVNIPLVLHGSSGIPDEQIQQAIKHGMAKINIATEVKDTFIRNLKKILAQNEDIDLRNVFPYAIQTVVDLLEHKMKVVHMSI